MPSDSSESEPKMKADVLRGQVEALLRRGGDWGRTAIMRELPGTVSEATLKRVLHGMIIDGAVESTGRGRATRYRFSAGMRCWRPLMRMRISVLRLMSGTSGSILILECCAKRSRAC